MSLPLIGSSQPSSTCVPNPEEDAISIGSSRPSPACVPNPNYVDELRACFPHFIELSKDFDISKIQTSDLLQMQSHNVWATQMHAHRNGTIFPKFCLVSIERSCMQHVTAQAFAFLEQTFGSELVPHLRATVSENQVGHSFSQDKATVSENQAEHSFLQDREDTTLLLERKLKKPAIFSLNNDSREYQLALYYDETELFSAKSYIDQDAEEKPQYTKAYFRLKNVERINKVIAKQDPPPKKTPETANTRLPALPNRSNDTLSESSANPNRRWTPMPLGTSASLTTLSVNNLANNLVPVIPSPPSTKKPEEVGAEPDAPLKLPVLQGQRGDVSSELSTRSRTHYSGLSQAENLSPFTSSNKPLVEAVIASLTQVSMEKDEKVTPEKKQKIVEHVITAISRMPQEEERKTPKPDSWATQYIGPIIMEVFLGKMHPTTFTNITNAVLQTMLTKNQLTSAQKEKIQPLFTTVGLRLWTKLLEIAQKKEPVSEIEAYGLSSLYGISFPMIKQFADFAKLDMVSEPDFNEYREGMDTISSPHSQRSQSFVPPFQLPDLSFPRPKH